MIDLENYKDNFVEKKFNIAIFKVPIKISDLLTYIQNDQINC